METVLNIPLYLFTPLIPSTWKMIFTLSSGAMQVFVSAPLNAPAHNCFNSFKTADFSLLSFLLIFFKNLFQLSKKKLRPESLEKREYGIKEEGIVDLVLFLIWLVLNSLVPCFVSVENEVKGWSGSIVARVGLVMEEVVLAGSSKAPGERVSAVSFVSFQQSERKPNKPNKQMRPQKNENEHGRDLSGEDGFQ